MFCKAVENCGVFFVSDPRLVGVNSLRKKTAQERWHLNRTVWVSSSIYILLGFAVQLENERKKGVWRSCRVNLLAWRLRGRCRNTELAVCTRWH